MLSDILKWGGNASNSPGGRVRAPTAARPEEPVVGSKAFPKFLVRPDLAAVSRAPGSRPGRRRRTSSSSASVSAASCTSKICSATSSGTRAPARSTRCRRHSRAVPACGRTVDGILCWDLFDYLDRPRSRRWRARSSACSVPAAPCSRSSARPPSQSTCHYTRYMIVDDGSFRHRYHAGAGGVEAGAPEPRHHPDVRGLGGLGFVPAQEQHPGNAATALVVGGSAPVVGAPD